MDRQDEKRNIGNPDELSDDRQGDVIGLSGYVPKEPSDPTASNDPRSVRQRRARLRDSEAEDRRDDDPYRQSKGATGIDMGAGGRGTDISGE